VPKIDSQVSSVEVSIGVQVGYPSATENDQVESYVKRDTGRAAVLPIRTETSTFVYRSSRPDAPDMPGERIEPGHIRSVWEPEEWEREDIRNGGNIALNVFAEPLPPISLNVTHERTKRARGIISAERFQSSDDGSWYLRVTRDGVTLTESALYRREGSARLAQQALKRILPALEI